MLRNPSLTTGGLSRPVSATPQRRREQTRHCLLREDPLEGGAGGKNKPHGKTENSSTG